MDIKNQPIIPEKDRHYTTHLTCSKKTANLIMNECIKEFLIHHPDFEGMRISQGFILKQVAEHYLRAP